MPDSKPPKPRKSITQVLEELHAQHPTVHAAAEIDRSWVWLACDLRGEANESLRKSLKEIGFKFARNGHTLPSGHLSHWGHSCQTPTRFHRGGKGGKGAGPKPNPAAETLDDNALAELAMSAFS